MFGLKSVGKQSENNCKQESPSAWTQEAYWPRCIKYSRPGLTAGGSTWGGVPPAGGTPSREYPLAGSTPPPARSDGGTRGGVPPGRRYPPARWTWLGYPPQVWTDKQSETITSHLVLHTRSVINTSKQESPPAWMQEAYCPLCSEYFFCCPTWVPPWGATQTPPGGTQSGTPPGGYPDPPGGVPS